jgi:hypothetical protein
MHNFLPTRVIGDGAIRREPYCTRIVSLMCSR